ncbi:hypothetical protein [Streptomyces sp. NPDC056337]|uniref:hypothetical protein n=1 Tax=Streptomyces sp. NPDC056337 TaxID=3345787 RepID=UPI0035E230BF
MARSTIQEKLAGTSEVNLTQILSIVDALAEYAQNNGTPLPNKETDRETWQNRVVASLKAKNKISHPGKGNPTTGNIEWDIRPLQEAQMDDLVEFIAQNESNAVATWLPQVMRGMIQARMSVTELLRQAAEDSPRGVVQTLKALDEEFPYASNDEWQGGWGAGRSEDNKVTVGTLIDHTAKHHGKAASPAIIVGLRRANLGIYVDDFLSRVATWYLAESVTQAVSHLRAASLSQDADDVLRAVSQRASDRILEVVLFLQHNWQMEDADLTLQAVGANCNSHKLWLVVQDFQKKGVSDETLLKIARGVSHGDYQEFISFFDESGDARFTDLLRKAADEPPF